MSELDILTVTRPQDSGELSAECCLLGRAAVLAGMGAWECDLATDRLTWTSAVYTLFGLPEDRTVNRNETVALYHEECRETMQRLRAEAIRTGGSFRTDVRIRRTDGVQRWMRLAGAAVQERGRTVRLYGMKQDVTEERAQWDALRQQAERDALTGLQGRAVFQQRFLDAPRFDPGLAPLGALVLFDLDGFKQVNDRHGHPAGDRILRLTGERLAAAFPDALMIVRLGGDEFAVLTDAALSPARLEARIAQFLRRLGDPMPWQDQILSVGASAGVAMPDDPFRYDAQALFARADAALYSAKAAGRNGYRMAAQDRTVQISSWT